MAKNGRTASANQSIELHDCDVKSYLAAVGDALVAKSELRPRLTLVRGER